MIRLPLKSLFLFCLFIFLPEGNFAARQEIVQDTLVPVSVKNSVPVGRAKARTSVVLSLGAIFATIPLAGIAAFAGSGGAILLLIGPLISLFAVGSGFAALRENRTFLRSGVAIDAVQKAKQKKVKSKAIAGITIGVFWLCYAVVLAVIVAVSGL